MPLTRANVETILIRRVGAWMTNVDLDGVTHAGANADLSDPIASALQQLGYSVADITNVSDGDLDDVTPAKAPALLDLAEYRTLETVLQSFTGADVRGLSFAINDDQFGERVLAALERLRAKLLAQYGIGIVSVAPYVGGISIADKETQEDDTDRVRPSFTRDLHKTRADHDDSRWWRY